MLFDGRLIENVKHTHKGTSFTKHYLKFYSVGHSQSTEIDNGSAPKSTKALLMQLNSTQLNAKNGRRRNAPLYPYL